MVSAGGDAGRAAFAQIGNKDGEDAAGAWRFALGRGEDGGHLLVGHGNFIENSEELLFGLGRESVDGVGDFAKDGGQRCAGFRFGHHALTS